MITLTITGRLCSDPEVRQVAGKEVTKLVIAGKFKGGLESQTIFVDVSIWGPRGQVAKQYMRRGEQITCVGKLMPPKVSNGKCYLHVDCYDFTLPVKGQQYTEDDQGVETLSENSEELPF